MGKEDIRLKSYLSDARRYADLWNGGVFGGRQIVKAEDIIELLEELGEVSKELYDKIYAQKDLEILKKWHKLAAKVSSISEFEEKM